LAHSKAPARSPWAQTISVGRNNLDTTFSGIIENGEKGAANGFLTKIGRGTLALTGSNSYSGGTTVENGNLLIENSVGSGTGTGPVQVNGGTLGGTGIIGGAVTIGTDHVDHAILEAGSKDIGLLTIENTLTFASRGICRWKVDASGMAADEIAAAGMTIRAGATFFAVARGNAELPFGTVFTVIDNTAALAISGTFSNLPDGSSITAGNNTFQASYEGGNGNDFTLTVVP